MPSSRVRHVILRTLYKQFKEAKIYYDPTYEEYFGKVQSPVHFRVIKKNFNNWVRTLASLKRYHPDVYKKPVVQPKPAPKKVEQPKPAEPKTEKAVKPVFKPSVKPKAAEK